MNKKAEIFKKYLEENGINCFQVDEIADDELNTVVFRSNIAVEGQMLPTLILADSSIYTVIRVLVAKAALKEDNQVELINIINELNRTYKVFKYYFDANGDLLLDSVIPAPIDQLDGDMVYTILDVMVQHITTEYRTLMKKIWG